MDATLNNESCEQVGASQENTRTDRLNRVPCVPVGFERDADGSYHVHFSVSDLVWVSHQPDLVSAQLAYDQAVQLAQLYAAGEPNNE
jgi:hypothetical protein